MSEQDFVGRVIGAASQGAVGAVVAASLSAVTEPLVNNMLVKRVPLMEAVKALDPEMIKKFLQTTLATNFIKFPFFEATNIIMQGVDLPPTAKQSVMAVKFILVGLLLFVAVLQIHSTKKLKDAQKATPNQPPNMPVSVSYNLQRKNCVEVFAAGDCTCFLLLCTGQQSCNTGQQAMPTCSLKPAYRQVQNDVYSTNHCDCPLVG